MSPPCSAGVLNTALAEARATQPPAITLTLHDAANLAAITRAWNKDRAERRAFPLAPADVLRNVLEATAALVAERDHEDGT